MSRFVFGAALVNGQLWAATLMLSTTPFAAAGCAVFSMVWTLIAYAIYRDQGAHQ